MNRATPKYDYPDRNLFENPERYYYATCDHPGFLEAWRKSRKEARCRLLERSKEPQAAKTVAETAPESVTPPGALILKDHLRKLKDSAGEHPSEPDSLEADLYPFIMKFEVHRRLFSHYGEDFKRHPDALPADMETYVLLAEVLGESASSFSGNKLRYLSTLLKLNDALTSVDVSEFNPGLAARVMNAIDLENRLIGRRETE